MTALRVQDEYKSLGELGIDLNGEMGYVLSEPGGEKTILDRILSFSFILFLISFHVMSCLFCSLARISKDDAAVFLEEAARALDVLNKAVAGRA